MNYQKWFNQTHGILKHAKIVSHSRVLMGTIAKGYINSKILKEDLSR